MRAFLNYVVRGRLHAITAAVGCAVLSLMFPPMSWVSGGIVGLVTLRSGVMEGAVVLASAVGLFGALGLAVVQNWTVALAIALVTWMPIWVLAAVLRSTVSQGVALAVGGGLGALGILAVHGLTGDVSAWWRELLEQTVAHAVRDSDLGLDGRALLRLSEALDAVAPLMSGIVVAGTLSGAVLMLMLARWWHATLDNPGGFGREFRALRLDRRVSYAAVMVGALALLAPGEAGQIGAELMLLALTLYLFQGLALAHSLVAGKSASIGWLVGLYALLALLPAQLVMLLGLTGFADTWIDFRSRWAKSAGG